MKRGKEIVIIGSGIGGLICGAILAREGFKITILEMNRQIGGCLQIYVRKKQIINTSVHYIGGINKGQNLYKIFNYLGIMDKLEIEKMDEKASDKVIFHHLDKEYNIAQGYPDFIRTLSAEFPGEEKAIEEYARVMQTISSNFSIFNTAGKGIMEILEYLKFDTREYIESLTTDKTLQNVLAGNNMTYGGMSGKTPLFIHALVINSYIESAWTFKKGSNQIAYLLAKVIRNHGGRILNNKKVTALVEQDGLLRYAETENGEVYQGDHFISNIHPVKTIEITRSNLLRNAYKNRVRSMENSISIFTINIVFKPGSFRFINSNYCCFVTDQVWDCMNYKESDWPLSYTLFFGRSRKNPDYAESASVMAYMKYDEVKKWDDTRNVVNSPEERGEDYDAFKKRKAEIFLNTIEIKFPGIRNAIESYYTCSPLTYRDYMGTDDGAVYGIVKDCKAPYQNMLHANTKIPNLLLVGQNTTIHGVHGVAMSSVVCCGKLMDFHELINKIEDAQV